MEVHQLELVNDDFERGAYERLDEEIRGMSRLFTPETLDLYGPLILVNIARQSKGRILTKYLNVLECRPTL